MQHTVYLITITCFHWPHTCVTHIGTDQSGVGTAYSQYCMIQMRLGGAVVGRPRLLLRCDASGFIDHMPSYGCAVCCQAMYSSWWQLCASWNSIWSQLAGASRESQARDEHRARSRCQVPVHHSFGNLIRGFSAGSRRSTLFISTAGK